VHAARARAQGHVALLAVQVFFGLFPLFGKVAFRDFSPRAVATWRIGAGALALAVAAAAVHGREAWPRRGDWRRLAACALLGVVLNMVLFLEGLERSTAVSTALLLPLIPVFTAGVAILARQERFERTRALGMAIAFAGAIWLVARNGLVLPRRHMVGNLLVVANELCYAVYLVVARPLLLRLPPLAAIAWVFVLSVPALPLVAAGADLWPASAGWRAWFSLAYVLVFATVLAYLLNVFALQRVSASTAAAFIFVQPAITCAGGVIALGEEVSVHMLIAAALTAAGVWIVARPARPH
jgi:drug/metabolite transporter (DMT)-like permease